MPCYLSAFLLFLCSFTGTQAQGPVLRPGDNLVTVNVPPIPATLAESVERYTHFRTAGFDGWHPTRREMLVATRFGDTAQIHHVRFPGGARTQLTFFPDNVAMARYQPTKAGDTRKDIIIRTNLDNESVKVTVHGNGS